MKILAPLLAALVLSACSPHPQTNAKQQYSIGQETQTSDLAVHFIELCSGIEMTDDNVGLVAVANCLGRVRGYADGAMLAAEVEHNQKLWCVSEVQRDRDVLNAVLAWIERNPDRYAAFVDNLDPRTAASAAIIQGLRETFTCRST